MIDRSGDLVVSVFNASIIGFFDFNGLPPPVKKTNAFLLFSLFELSAIGMAVIFIAEIIKVK